ncbi:MAG: aminotransferase class V-fold PLP-dependent enzyme [Balneolaceae bacterium]
MEKRIRSLEKASSGLEPTEDQRLELMKHTEEYAGRFLKSLPKQKAYHLFDETVDSLLEEPIGEEPGLPEHIIHDIENRVIPPGLNAASGSHMAYIPGGGLVSGATGDYLAAVTNPYAGVYYSSPGAVNLERRLIRWTSELAGYPDTSGGFLASGGSIANLTAVVTAREAHKIAPEKVKNVVVYQTAQTHHCVDRALNIAGMGTCIRQTVPVDDRFRMDPEKLEQCIENDKACGRQPWMVVASAGTTDAGAVDPLDQIAEISGKHSLWFHVDAAYGGFFMLTDYGKKLMSGIEKSDSAVLDPHKSLFIPYGLGILIVRNEELLAKAHHYEASYMQDTKSGNFARSPADLSPELSKHFRALRLWVPLKLHGVKAFRSALNEKRLLAKYAWEKIASMPGFEVGPEPELSVFLFRYNPETGDPDKLNREIHEWITGDGRIFFSTTTYNSHFMLRLAILSVRTHLDTVIKALEIIREAANAVKK